MLLIKCVNLILNVGEQKMHDFFDAKEKSDIELKRGEWLSGRGGGLCKNVKEHRGEE